jgi:hypothetical protein
MIDGQQTTKQEGGFIALLESLPLMYTSLEEHQKQDPFCVNLLEKSDGALTEKNFRVYKELLINP